MRIHFLSDVFVAVAVVIAYNLPNVPSMQPSLIALNREL